MLQLRLALCQSSVDERLGHLALCQVALTADGKTPEWIMLVPAGEKIEALDGRKYSNAEPQAIVDAFNADPRDLPIDWNHAEEKKAPIGEEAPAAGWVDRMEVRSGAVWGRVEWTPRGAKSLINKESRYLSPAFIFEKATKIIKKLFSAGLVNTPAFDMPAVARAGDDPEPTENIMDPKLLKLLGLKEGATQKEIDVAFAKYAETAGKVTAELETARAKLNADPAAEVVKVTKELETVKAKLKTTETELANARNANPGLDKFVPRAEYDAALARAKTAEAKIEDEAKATHKKDAETEVAAAMKAGKVTPANKEFYLDTCSTKEGLEKFRAFAKDAPVVGDPSDLDDKTPPAGSGTADADELQVAASFGMTKEEYVKARAEAFPK